MKITKYIVSILLLSTIIVSCEKEFPEPDTCGCGIPCTHTNKYILKKISANIYKKDTVWLDSNYYRILPIKVIDTVKYNDFYINVDLSGYLISENVVITDTKNTDTIPYLPNPIEQKYFINKISDIEVKTNISYNDILYNDNLFWLRYLNFYSYDKKRQLIERNNFYDEELGYTPFMIKINIPPDTSKWVSFTVKITDDNNNIFTSQTDSVYILNN